jgi:aerotaxis receptor
MVTDFSIFIETDVPYDEEIISRTDKSGIITYVNDTFAKISGYEPEELIGKPHSIIRHPDMPKSVFKELWESLKDDKDWSGYVKNLRKDGGYYWVFARVSKYLKNGEFLGYKSIREPVEKEKRLQMQDIYDKMRFKEEHQSRVVLYIDNSKLDLLKEMEK